MRWTSNFFDNRDDTQPSRSIPIEAPSEEQAREQATAMMMDGELRVDVIPA